jgi:hypothetical protein
MGVTTITAIEVPVSFQTPSRLAAVTTKRYEPYGTWEKYAVRRWPASTQSLSSASSL